MLHMLAKDGYAALKREAEDGDGVIEHYVRNLLYSRILEKQLSHSLFAKRICILFRWWVHRC